MMVDNNLRKIIMVIGITTIIILSGLFYVQDFSQGSAKLSVLSIGASSGNKGVYFIPNNGPNLYTLNINLNIKIKGHMTVTGLLSGCSFGLAVNDSTIWKVITVICTGILPSTTYSGSYNFSLIFGIETWKSDVIISTPFLLSYMVYSNAFNVESPYYNLFITSS